MTLLSIVCLQIDARMASSKYIDVDKCNRLRFTNIYYKHLLIAFSTYLNAWELNKKTEFEFWAMSLNSILKLKMSYSTQCADSKLINSLSFLVMKLKTQTHMISTFFVLFFRKYLYFLFSINDFKIWRIKKLDIFSINILFYSSIRRFC